MSRIAFWQFVWIWNPVKWDLDFERVYYYGQERVGLYVLYLGPLRVGVHMTPDE